MKLLAALLLALVAVFLPGCESCDSIDGAQEGVQAETASSSLSSVVMERGSEEYRTNCWTVDSLSEHFRNLGFENIETMERSGSETNYYEIRGVYYADGLFGVGDESWNAGDSLDTGKTIRIYYAEDPLLTLENCPELAGILAGSESYSYVAGRYDGRYVSFDAYVSYFIPGSYCNDVIINVSNEDYEYNESHGNTIRIGMRANESDLELGNEVGTKVHVEGRISDRWSSYYQQFYIDGLKLYAVNS